MHCSASHSSTNWQKDGKNRRSLGWHNKTHFWSVNFSFTFLTEELFTCFFLLSQRWEKTTFHCGKCNIVVDLRLKNKWMNCKSFAFFVGLSVSLWPIRKITQIIHSLLTIVKNTLTSVCCGSRQSDEERKRDRKRRNFFYWNQKFGHLVAATLTQFNKSDGKKQRVKLAATIQNHRNWIVFFLFRRCGRPLKMNSFSLFLSFCFAYVQSKFKSLRHRSHINYVARHTVKVEAKIHARDKLKLDITHTDTQFIRTSWPIACAFGELHFACASIQFDRNRKVNEIVCNNTCPSFHVSQMVNCRC